ncbi:hypothetical protein CHH75_08145 [Paenibacillus sp. 7541]|nr:hypothetical protein CHH75_08145 [Paenibacillus sp. 7541]
MLCFFSEDSRRFPSLENSKYIVKITDSYGNEIRHTFSTVAFLIKFAIYCAIVAYFFMRKKNSLFFRLDTTRQRAVTISFHAFTILILVLSGFTGSVTPLMIVFIFHGVMHFVQAYGGIRANI